MPQHPGIADNRFQHEFMAAELPAHGAHACGHLARIGDGVSVHTQPPMLEDGPHPRTEDDVST